MRTNSATFAIFLGLAIFVLPHMQTIDAQPTPNAEQEVRAIETVKLQYPLDPARWAARVDDNAVFTQGSGKVITKVGLLDSYRQPAGSYKNSLHMIDPAFKQFGDTAVITYAFTRTRQNGQYTVSQHIRRTAVYQHQASKWQLIASTSVVFPNLDRQQKRVDPKILDSYVGVYEGNLRITHDGTRLMARSPDDKEKVELLAVSNEAFSIRGEGDSILFVFEKMADGHVQLRAHNVGGSEEVAKRLK